MQLGLMNPLMRTARGLGAAAIVLLTACPEKGADSATDTEATTAPTTTTEPTTTDATTMADATTAADATTTMESTTTATPTTEPSTDGTTGDPATCEADGTSLAASCAAMCSNFSNCDDADPNACTESCVMNAFKPTQACTCGSIAYNQCLAGLTCEELNDGAAAGPDSPCFGPAASYVVGCGDCISQPEFIADDRCVAILECPDVISVSFVCAEGTCTCNDGMTDYKTCPDPGVCAGMDPAAFNAAASECCGVPF
ncbi:hypothetical protein [Nannocystis sp. SCPEA4]|uniref:hypothetical protein n=1 Tax=Nannocystis sp. SCPEA4 TaxID=2996787 RepID=UPI00226E9107|nr:hypothetical protein [Nannocystis sp. SCPEA4]MCY1059215.1 hypothetical protein [Nannocystis sp. SCPEA4]